MANQVTLQTTFIQWKDIINAVIDEIGDLDSLPTVDKTSLINSLIELDDDFTTLMSDVGDVDALTTTTQVSTVLAINELVSSLGNINTNVNTNATSLGTITNLTTEADTSIVLAINELNTLKADKKSISYTNLDKNNGRFSSDEGVIATTTDSGSIVSSNLSTLSMIDKFVDDNITNGGVGAVLPTNVIELMTELVTAGRTDQLNGYEFFILDILAGAGVDDGINENSVDYYPVLSTDRTRLGRIGQEVTWQGWVKVSTVSEVALLGDATTNISINGSEVANPYVLSEADGWVFVKLVKELVNEYENYFPSIRCVDGTTVHVALSGFFDGDVDIPSHLSLI